MSKAEFIQELERKGIHLSLDGDELVCKAAPGTLTTGLLKRLKDEKRELSDVLRKSNLDQVTTRTLIPLSPTQFGLWFQNELEGGQSNVYNSSASFRISGKLDNLAFSKSLDAIYNRQDIFRTTFDSVDGQPFQVVGPRGSFPLQLVDFSDVPEQDWVAEINRTGLAARMSPFNLKAGLCARSSLIQMSDHEHYFIVVIHHILTDGWSMGLFKKELSIFYTWFIENPECTEPPSESELLLPPLTAQYSDYAMQTRAERGSEASQKSMNYWLNQLEGVPTHINLETDRPRPASQTFKGSGVKFRISPALHRDLVEFGRANRSSLYMTLMTGLKILLRQYSRQNDIVVGSVTANRTREEYENIVGFFANTLAIRTRIPDNSTPVELLNRVRSTVFDAHDHQNIAFEQLVAALPGKRDPSRSPVFQVMLVFQNAPAHSLALKGLSVKQDKREGHSAIVDMLFQLKVANGDLEGEVRFNIDLFNRERIEQIVEDFKMCLTTMVDNPDAPIAD